MNGKAHRPNPKSPAWPVVDAVEERLSELLTSLHAENPELEIFAIVVHPAGATASAAIGINGEAELVALMLSLADSFLSRVGLRLQAEILRIGPQG